MSDEAGPRGRLLALFNVGIAVVRADFCLPQCLPHGQCNGRTALFALGKAAGHMARVALDRMVVDEALIVTRHGHMPDGWTAPAFARVIEAGHPNPDAASLAAGEAAMTLARSLKAGDRMIALVSGGGSALMSAPIEGLSFAEKQAINRALLASGAPIAEMNCVRAALSRVKGGRLAELAWPAQVLTYVMSDVAGDDPALVASGPTCPLPDGDDPARIVEQYRIPVAPHIRTHLAQRSRSAPSVGSAVVVASAGHALAAMADAAKGQGFAPIVLGDDLECDAQLLAREHARLALELRGQGRKAALISGGEASVRVYASVGSGGRNLTYALALAIALDGAEGICGFAADSDGIDGTSEAAGAMVFPATLSKATARGLDPKQMLRAQTSATFFERLGDHIVTGPTGVNVNDLRVILVDGAAVASL